MNEFIRGHRFFLLQQTSSFTTSQRKAFEMDVFLKARELGFSSGNAEKQIIHARRMCGQKNYQGGRSKLDNEVSDSEVVTWRDSIIKHVDCDRVGNSNSSGTLRSVEPSQDPEKITKSSNQKNTHSVINDEADVATLPHKKKKRHRSTSSVGKESVFSEKEKPSDSKQAGSDDGGSRAQIRLQQPKSDGVNGDPSQLFEVPDEVSQYLEVQANKKRAKKDKKILVSDDKFSSAPTRGSASGDERNDFLHGHGLGDITHRGGVPQKSHPTDANETVKKDAKSEEKARETGRSPRETGSPRPSADYVLFKPNGPRKELTIEEKAERKARKKERRQLAKANLETVARDTGRELPNLLTAKSAEDRSKKGQSLDEVRGEAAPQSQKHKKKKHKPKKRSASKESRFQSPMIQ